MTVGDRVIWRRQKRGGVRRIDRIPVVIAGFYPATGNVVVIREDGRGEAIVKPSSLVDHDA